MKKTLATLGLCFALSGCLMQANLDRAAEKRAEHLAADRAENGCQLLDDHAAYRNCLMNTYYKSKPKTYVSARDEKGKALAIIRNDSTSSYDEKTGTYKTERVIVIETEEKLVSPSTETFVITEEQELPIIENKNTKVDSVITTKEEVKPVEVNTQTTEEKIETAQPKEETWWDKYQKDRKPTEGVKCPCEDPNDPCPQCVDK